MSVTRGYGVVELSTKVVDKVDVNDVEIVVETVVVKVVVVSQIQGGHAEFKLFSLSRRYSISLFRISISFISGDVSPDWDSTPGVKEIINIIIKISTNALKDNILI